MTTTIKLDKIVAAILALDQAIPIVYHAGRMEVGAECIRAMQGLKYAIADFDIAVIDIKEAA